MKKKRDDYVIIATHPDRPARVLVPCEETPLLDDEFRGCPRFLDEDEED